MRPYRVQANYYGLRAGETVMIDPDDPGWWQAIEEGVLVPLDPSEYPA